MDRPRWRFTANARVHARVQAGLEFNAAVGEFSPLANVFVLTEGERTPALFLGTSSDRIGSPEGQQAYYMTASKYLPTLRMAVNATVNWSEWDDALNFPFGAAVELGGGFAARYMYDGERSHALLDRFIGDRFGVSLLAIWLEDAGLAIHGGF